MAEDRETEGPRTGPGGDGGPSGGDGEGRPGGLRPRRGQRTGPSRGWRTGPGWGPGAGGSLQRTGSRARRRCAAGRPGAASPLPVRSDRNFWRAVGWRAEGKEEVGAARAATATHGRGGQVHASSRGVRPFAQGGGMRGRSELQSLPRRGPRGICPLPPLSCFRYRVRCKLRASSRHPLREVPARKAHG